MTWNESSLQETIEELTKQNQTLQKQLEKANSEIERLRKELEEALLVETAGGAIFKT